MTTDQVRCLKIHEVRALMRLVGRVWDVRQEPKVWRREALLGLCELLEAPIGIALVARQADNTYSFQIESALAEGFEHPEERAAFLRYLYDRNTQSPMWRALIKRLQRRPDQILTATRQEVVPDRVWYEHPHFVEACRPARVDHRLVSAYHGPKPGLFRSLTLHRRLGSKRPFSRREAVLLELFHEQVRPIYQAETDTPLPVEHLAPRLRQTLSYLLAGKSEKQIAELMEISPHTVHDYVKALHRHFDVSSRSELLARFIS